MKILYLDPNPDIKVERIIKKIDCEFYTFNIINHLQNIKLNFQREKGFILFLIKYLLLCPTLITKEIILKNIKKSAYGRDLRNCIVDQIERESGELSTKQDSKYFIRRKFLNYSYKLIKLLALIEFIKLFISEKKINCIVIPQLDGFPYGGISSLCIKNNLYIGSSINRPPTLLVISKGYFNIHCPIKADLEILRELSDDKLDKQIEKIKLNYIKNKIWFIEPPHNKSKIIYKKVEYYKSIIDPSKKTGVVLTHVFTDQARPRLLNTWYENYLDWFIETINFCKKNNNLNWIFKSHPNANWYPIKEYHQKYIENLIKINNFTYIDSTKTKFLHDEVSQIASIVVTCGGTCKIEYPALFRIPVISCKGRDSLYMEEGLSLIANSQEEYEDLIMNAHIHTLSEREIRICKEALSYLHNKNLSPDQNEKITNIYKYYDSNNDLILRNY